MSNINEVNEKVDRLEEEIKEIRQKDIPNILIELGKLNIKSGIWGAGTSIAVVIAAMLLKIL